MIVMAMKRCYDVSNERENYDNTNMLNMKMLPEHDEHADRQLKCGKVLQGRQV